MHPVRRTLSVLALLVWVAGCGRTGTLQSTGRPSTMGLKQADPGRSPCDHDIARRIDPNAPIVGARRQAAVSTNGPDKPAMVAIDSPNRYARAGGPDDIKAIVLHHTASAADAERIGMFFSKPSSEVSSHYVVGKNGVLVQCVPDSAASWHAGPSKFLGRDNANHFTIGIEICNLGNNSDPYPQTQYEALGRLMAFLMVRYNLNWSVVTRHRDIAYPLGRKTDTSNNFDVEALRRAVVAAGGPSAGLLPFPTPAPTVAPSPAPSAAPSIIPSPSPSAGLRFFPAP
ncbi:MAG: N-acetylmuramoyl-L-alanine amidase [Candidatus Sericytochromatia bacterium]|nr:N-acetylmuramoyl-L-alanine amidase [Candidatus Sericytochromatia bacterium]